MFPWAGSTQPSLHLDHGAALPRRAEGGRREERRKSDMSDEDVRLALRAWPAEPDSVMEVARMF